MEMVEEFKLEAANKSIDFCCTRTSTSQQTFVGLEDVLKTSSRHVFKTCLQGIFNMSSAWQFFCLSRRFEDVLEDEKLLRRRRLKDALETKKFLLGISVSNKSKCVSNKSVFHKSTTDESKASPKWIN